MPHKNYIFFLVLILVFVSINAQSNKNYIKISGTVTDMANSPIKNAIVFIDSIKTNIKTNRKGFYKVKLNPQTSEVAVYVEGQGLLAKKFNCEKTINFVFRTDKNEGFQEDMIIGMGYILEVEKTFNNFKTGTNYSDYPSVFEILDKLFPFVKVRNGIIKIGNGPNAWSGDTSPLIFIDDQRSNLQALAVLSTNDINKIRVIRRGSEAAVYGGLKAANGVILIDLKTGN